MKIGTLCFVTFLGLAVGLPVFAEEDCKTCGGAAFKPDPEIIKKALQELVEYQKKNPPKIVSNEPEPLEDTPDVSSSLIYNTSLSLGKGESIKIGIGPRVKTWDAAEKACAQMPQSGSYVLPTAQEHYLVTYISSKYYREDAASVMLYLGIPHVTDDFGKALYMFEAWVKDGKDPNKYRGTSNLLRYNQKDVKKVEINPFSSHENNIALYKEKLTKFKDNPFRGQTYKRLIQIAEKGVHVLCVKRK